MFPNPHEMEFDDCRQRLLGECENLDPLKDTFSGVLRRVDADWNGPRPMLGHRELESLHGIYLKALSEAIERYSRRRAG